MKKGEVVGERTRPEGEKEGEEWGKIQDRRACHCLICVRWLWVDSFLYFSLYPRNWPGSGWHSTIAADSCTPFDTLIFPRRWRSFTAHWPLVFLPSVSLSLDLGVCVCLSLSLYINISILSLSLCVSLSLSLLFFFSLSLYLSLSAFFCWFFSGSLSLYIHTYIYIYLSLSLSLSLSASFSQDLSLSLSFYLLSPICPCISLCTPVHVHLRVWKLSWFGHFSNSQIACAELKMVIYHIKWSYVI